MKIAPYDNLSLSENQLIVLKCLKEHADSDEEGTCYYFSGIAKETGIEMRLVRLAVRALVRKGLAEYHRGLFKYESGEIAGSGHCASRAGIEVIARMEELARVREEAKTL